MNKINNALEKMMAILITKGIQKEQKESQAVGDGTTRHNVLLNL